MHFPGCFLTQALTHGTGSERRRLGGEARQPEVDPPEIMVMTLAPTCRYQKWVMP